MDIQAEMRAGGKQEKCHRRAVLIPTEPPPLKAGENVRYMPPSMRKEIEEKEKEERRALISKRNRELSGIEKPAHALPENTPKDLKYMPPAMRAEFAKKDRDTD